MLARVYNYQLLAGSSVVIVVTFLLVARLITERIMDSARAQQVLTPRFGAVVELQMPVTPGRATNGRADPDPNQVDPTGMDRATTSRAGPDPTTETRVEFTQAQGPYTSYRRSVTLSKVPNSEGQLLVRQIIDVELQTPFLKWLLWPPIAAELKRLTPRKRNPWWLPPEILDARSISILCVLAILAIIAGYQNSLMSQTLTYAVKDFHASNFAESVVISLSRIDVLFTLLMMVVADRLGRRKVLLHTVFWGAILSALGALAPNLQWLALAQSAARSFVAAALALIVIYAAEEMPAGSRAYAIGILTACGVIGAGANVFLVAGVNFYSWRTIFAISALGCLFIPACAKVLPESKRFIKRESRLERSKGVGLGVVRDIPTLRSHMSRLILLICLGLLIQLFAFPTTQFLNQFLRTERGYTPGHIVIYNVFTTIPGALGLYGGGRLADKYGRKGVAAFSLVVGSLAMVAGYLSHGWEMWFFHMIAQVLGGALIPATTVLGPELFPTNLRGVSFGIFTIAQGVGSVIGLLLVGWLAGSARLGNLGLPMAVVGVGPILMAIILLRYFPETAHLELEQINPEDST